MLNRQSTLITILLALAGVSCNEEGFRGGGAVQARSGNVTSMCEPGAQASQGQGEIAGVRGTTIQVSGEFCTASLDVRPDPALTILFVVDFSMSMQGADAGNGQTCGRLDAARTVLSVIAPPGLRDENGNPPAVNVGVVSFDTTAKLQVNSSPVSTIGNQLTFGNFCRADGSSTNYEAAFTEANKVLSQVGGNKVVYFISDGLPTSYGATILGQTISTGLRPDRQTSKSRGITAATALRSSADTTLNVLYLKNNNQTYQDPDELDPMPYLQQVAPPVNGQQRVVIAENAGELAQKIQLFERPKAGEINGSGLTGILTADGFSSRSVQVHLDKDASVPGRFKYLTDSFQLNGRPGESVVNTLTVTATASDGTRPQSVTTVTYVQKTSIQ